MTTIDFLILGFLAYQAIGGFRNDFVKIMLQFIAILLSFKISILAYPELNQFLKIKLHLSHTPSTIVSFILIWIGIFMIIKIIGIILDKLIEFSGLSIINRLGGLIFGIGKGICFLLLIIFPLFIFKPKVIEESKILHPWKPLFSSLIQDMSTSVSLP